MDVDFGLINSVKAILHLVQHQTSNNDPCLYAGSTPLPNRLPCNIL